MKIIVGLGNKGKEYEETRHNAGFKFLDALATCREIAPVGEVLQFHTVKKFEADIAETTANGERIILVKPQTYMNASGRSASKILKFYKATPKDLIVVSDDVDLPLGKARIRNGGSSGGQKGLQNIIDSIGSDEFLRVRLGISLTGDKKDQIETTDFVLSKFKKRELPVLEKVISSGINYLVEFIGNKSNVIPHHTFEVVPPESGPEKL